MDEDKEKFIALIEQNRQTLITLEIEADAARQHYNPRTLPTEVRARIERGIGSGLDEMIVWLRDEEMGTGNIAVSTESVPDGNANEVSSDDAIKRNDSLLEVVIGFARQHTTGIVRLPMIEQRLHNRMAMMRMKRANEVLRNNQRNYPK